MLNSPTKQRGGINMFLDKLPRYDILMESINYCPITEAIEYENFVYEMNLIETTLYDMVNKETSNHIKRVAAGVLTEAAEGEKSEKSGKVKEIITKIIDFLQKMVNGLIEKISSMHMAQTAWLRLNKGILANVVITNDREIDTFKNAISPKSIPIGHTTDILLRAVAKMSSPNVQSDTFADSIASDMYKAIGINKDGNTVEQLMGDACKYKLSQINSKSSDMIKFIESGLKETISEFNNINTRLTTMVRATNMMTTEDASAIKSVVDEYSKICKEVALGSAKVGNEVFRLLKTLAGEKASSKSDTKPSKSGESEGDKTETQQSPQEHNSNDTSKLNDIKALDDIDAQLTKEKKELENCKQDLVEARPSNKAAREQDVADQKALIARLENKRNELELKASQKYKY
jgi:hypothetical protein